jgi:FKBP-type peptidyl-prolyl cis-trans isomerase FkpA
MKRQLGVFFVLSALALATLPGVAGCAGSPSSPSTTAPFSQVDLRVGTGDEAVAPKSLSVFYTGWLYNPVAADQKGARFDSSNGTPFTFTLGAGQVIAGWDQGLVGMKVGGLRRLVVPPALAYGDTRQGLIPPHATLVFEVELVKVE